jgi:uncharacterized protein (TIGR02246 family)
MNNSEPQRPQSEASNDEIGVRKVVEAFYSAYRHNFEGANAYAADDWHHIGPGGGWTRGRKAVLERVREVHSGYLKDAIDTIEEMSVRFATRDVAVVTVISRSSPYVFPTGIRHENERNIRSFVIANRDGRWQLMHDQNTLIATHA